MRSGSILAATLFYIFFTSAACVHTGGQVKAVLIPSGFARYTKAKEIKAVSPEGVTYRVRSEANKPFAELTFWTAALKKRMLDAGYIFLGESSVTADNREGYLLELTAPYGQQDYTYLMAVFVAGKKIVIVEAAGDVTALAARREAIVAAIGRLKF